MKKDMEKSISIKDIARECGVSTATVSRVINKTGRYSKETEEKVLAVIHDQKYSPNLVAKGLRRRKTMNVGVVVPDITNEFFTKLVYELENSLFLEGYQVFLCNTNEDIEREKEYARNMSMQNVCGMIYICCEMPGEMFEDSRLPAVFVDRIPRNLPEGYSQISSDNEQGGYIAAKELLEQGCKKCLVMTGSGDVRCYQERYDGFARAMQESGMGESNICKVVLKRLHYHDAHQEMTRILDSGEFDCDSIFAASDWLAIGCFRALEEHGISVPDQVKIVGFDDISITAFNTVPITSVHQQVDKLGRLATQQLLLAIDEKENNAQTIRVPVYLIPRASTRGEKAEKYV